MFLFVGLFFFLVYDILRDRFFFKDLILKLLCVWDGGRVRNKIGLEMVGRLEISLM